MSAQPAFRGKTWCQFYTECKHGGSQIHGPIGEPCTDALTPSVRLDASIAGEPCAVWLFPPSCFVPVIPGAGGRHA